MTIESAADRAVFMDADGFGQAVTLARSAGGASVAFTAIFDSAYLLAETGQSSVATVAPVLTCRDDDLPSGGVAFGDTVVVAGTVYKIRDIQPDGTGIVVLLLEKQ